MRFKRPQVRYADTQQPATPYQAAGQVWDERIGSARVQAKNWRFMAFGCLTLAVLMAGGLVWRSAQSIVTPYVVEVDNAGQVRAVGEAATPYQPSDAQIADALEGNLCRCTGYRPILDAGQRELVLDRVMALDQDEIDLDDLKWVVLMVLFNQPGAEAAYAWMENQIFQDEPEPLH